MASRVRSSSERRLSSAQRVSSRDPRVPIHTPSRVASIASSTRRRQVLAHVVGSNRQFAMAAVDHHGELHRSRATPVGQRVERGANRATGEEDVIDQDHRAVGEIVIDEGQRRSRHGMQRQVIAIERDVERDRRADVSPEISPRTDATWRAKGSPPVWSPMSETVREIVVAFDDLVRHPRQGARDVIAERSWLFGKNARPRGVWRSSSSSYLSRRTSLSGLVSRQSLGHPRVPEELLC